MFKNKLPTELCPSKCQKISKANYGVLNSPKKRTLRLFSVHKIISKFGFWENCGHHKLLSRFTDLYIVLLEDSRGSF